MEIDLIRYYHAPYAALAAEYGAQLVAAMVVNLPPDSATMRHYAQGWALEAQLLAGVFDRLVEANWQRSADGQKGRNKPKPLPRPGVQGAGVRVGSGSMSLDEAKYWLAQRRAGGGVVVGQETIK